MTLEVHLTIPAASAATVFPALPSRTRREDTRSSYTGLATDRARTIIEAGLTGLCKPGFANTIPAADPAVLRAHVAVLVAITGVISAPGDVLTCSL